MINLMKVTHFIHNRQLLYEATVIVQVCYFRIICTDWTKKDCRNLCIRCAKGDIKKRFATFASIVGRARHTRSRQTERTREVRGAAVTACSSSLARRVYFAGTLSFRGNLRLLASTSGCEVLKVPSFEIRNYQTFPRELKTH